VGADPLKRSKNFRWKVCNQFRQVKSKAPRHVEKVRPKSKGGGGFQIAKIPDRLKGKCQTLSVTSVFGIRKSDRNNLGRSEHHSVRRVELATKNTNGVSGAQSGGRCYAVDRQNGLGEKRRRYKIRNRTQMKGHCRQKSRAKNDGPLQGVQGHWVPRRKRNGGGPLKYHERTGMQIRAVRKISGTQSWVGVYVISV